MHAIKTGATAQTLSAPLIKRASRWQSGVVQFNRYDSSSVAFTTRRIGGSAGFSLARWLRGSLFGVGMFFVAQLHSQQRMLPLLWFEMVGKAMRTLG